MYLERGDDHRGYFLRDGNIVVVLLHIMIVESIKVNCLATHLQGRYMIYLFYLAVLYDDPTQKNF